jgi:hypothetical protein
MIVGLVTAVNHWQISFKLLLQLLADFMHLQMLQSLADCMHLQISSIFLNMPPQN